MFVYFSHVSTGKYEPDDYPCSFDRTYLRDSFKDAYKHVFGCDKSASPDLCCGLRDARKLKAMYPLMMFGYEMDDPNWYTVSRQIMDVVTRLMRV